MGWTSFLSTGVSLKISSAVAPPYGPKSQTHEIPSQLQVWACAEKVYPGKYFDRYAVLGDDIVIADKEVARVYLDTLEEFCIPVSKQKTLVSDRGAAEFAKRFFIKGLTVDLSPVSLACCLNSHHPYGLLGLHMTYPIRRFSTLLRIESEDLANVL